MIVVILILLLVGARGVVQVATVLEALVIRAQAIRVSRVLIANTLMAVKVAVSGVMKGW